MAAIQPEGLTKRYVHDIYAINDLSLTVSAGATTSNSPSTSRVAD
jgi:hypothetical protein